MFFEMILHVVFSQTYYHKYGGKSIKLKMDHINGHEVNRYEKCVKMKNDFNQLNQSLKLF